MNTEMELLQHLGLSKKEAAIYKAVLEHGESTVSQIASRSGVKRTTIYELLEELLENGTLIKQKVGKKIYYLATPPAHLVTLRRRALNKVEDKIDVLNMKHLSAFDTPKINFYHGELGFKQIWDTVLQEKTKEFWIITNGSLFEEYISNSYLYEEILSRKKKLKIKSKQLITDSQYAKQITKSDKEQNRVTRILPPDTVLPFTQIITDTFCAFISEPEQNCLFIIENKAFAHYQKSLFDVLWDSAS